MYSNSHHYFLATKKRRKGEEDCVRGGFDKNGGGKEKIFSEITGKPG